MYGYEAPQVKRVKMILSNSQWISIGFIFRGIFILTMTISALLLYVDFYQNDLFK